MNSTTIAVDVAKAVFEVAVSNQVVVAIAREMAALAWTIARVVPLPS